MAGEGNTEEEKLAQKEAEVEQLRAQLEKAEGRVENAQAKIHEWEAEVGNNRKEMVENAKIIKELGQELADATKALRKAQDELMRVRGELAELKKQGPESESESTRKADLPPEETVEQIEASLTKDEQKVVSEVWNELSPSKRAECHPDRDTYNSEERKRLLLKARALARQRRGTDLSDWRSTPARNASSSSGEDELDKLFRIKKERAESYPSASNNDPTRGQPVRAKGVRQEEAKWL